MFEGKVIKEIVTSDLNGEEIVVILFSDNTEVKIIPDVDGYGYFKSLRTQYIDQTSEEMVINLPYRRFVEGG